MHDVLMMRIFIATVCMFFCLGASAAQACICTQLSPEVVERVKSNTAYAGVVEVLDIQKKGKKTTIFHLDSVSRRAGDIEGKFKIIKTYEDSCDWAPDEKGFYEVIISRRDNKIQFAGRCLHIHKFIENFEESPVIYRPDYLTQQEECRKVGGIWGEKRERIQCILQAEGAMDP